MELLFILVCSSISFFMGILFSSQNLRDAQGQLFVEKIEELEIKIKARELLVQELDARIVEMQAEKFGVVEKIHPK